MTLVDSIVGIEALSRYLDANGWANRVEGGAIYPEGRRVKRITMRIGGALWFGGAAHRVRIGPVPVYASQSVPVQVAYALDVDPAKTPNDYRLELDWKRDGLFTVFGDISEAWFEGGPVAARLNAKPEGVLALARLMRRFEKLTVEPDVAAAQVRVVHQQKMEVRFSLLGSELFDVERNLPPFGFFAALEWLAGELAAAEKPAPKKRPARRAAAPRGRKPKRCGP